MVITPEERQEIIDVVIAQVLPTLRSYAAEQAEQHYLAMPETIGSLMTQHAALLDVNKKFYGEYPEFAKHKTVVQSVIEQLEGQHPTRDYKDLLKEAVPVITERIKVQNNLDMTTVKRPDRYMPHLTLEVDKDKPHGEL